MYSRGLCRLLATDIYVRYSIYVFSFRNVGFYINIISATKLDSTSLQYYGRDYAIYAYLTRLLIKLQKNKDGLPRLPIILPIKGRALAITDQPYNKKGTPLSVTVVYKTLSANATVLYTVTTPPIREAALSTTTLTTEGGQD